MPSTYTTSLRLTLPATGELAGSWGSTVNTGITTLTETAIAGTAAVAMTDANYTLTVANGTTDQARNMFITLSGTLSTTRNVICPSVSKLYVVTNSTTGSQSIVFKTAAGAGITVGNGQRKMLYCDGTNVLDATTGYTSLLFDAGSVSAPSISFVGNTTTGFWLPTTSTVALSTAGSERLRVDSTGNVGIGTSSPTSKLHIVGGALSVQNTFGFGATFTNTGGVGNYITLADTGSSSAIGTSNGNLILYTAGNTTERMRLDASGNLGIGTSSPGEKLQVAGAIRATGAVAANATGGILAYQGASTVMLGAWGADASTYGAIQFYQANSTGTLNRTGMLLDTAGNLGLGATSISALGSGYTTQAIQGANGAGIRLYAGATEYGRLYADSTVGLVLQAVGATTPQVFYLNGAERARIDSSGNLGIGTTAPEQRLHLSNTGSTSVAIKFTNSAASAGIISYSSDSMLFYTANAIRATIDTSGNLGLGVTPSAWGSAWKALQVGSTGSVFGASTQILLASNHYVDSAFTERYVATGFATSYQQASGQHRFFTAPSGTAGNAITFTQAMTLDASGNLGVGTASPTTKLHVSGAAPSAGSVGIRVEDTAGSSSAYIIKTGATYSYAGVGANETWLYSQGTSNLTLGPDGVASVKFVTNGSERARIDASGNLGVGTASPSARIHVDRDGPRTLSLAPANRTAGSGSYILMGNSDAGGSTGPNVIVSANRAIQFGVGTSFNSDTGGTFTEYMRIDSSGNLGVGTSSPVAKLDVGGSTASAPQAIFARGVSDPNFRLTAFVGDAGSAAGTVTARFGQSYGGAAIGSGFEFLRGGGAADGALNFISGSAATMRLDASGNLGLGVTPSAWNASFKSLDFGSTGTLTTNGAASILASNLFVNTGGTTVYKTTAAATYFQQQFGAFTWYTAPSGTAGNTITFTQAMTLEASGNLLVGGTTNPYVAANRGIVQSNGATSALFGLAVGGTAAGYIFSSGSGLSIGAPTGQPILFDINGERARIDSSGNFLVGKTTAGESTGGNGTTIFTGVNAEVAVNAAGSTSGTTGLALYSSGAAAFRFYVNMAGTVFATSTTISAISDQRLKENIRDLDVGLNAVMALKPRVYDWKEGKGKDIKGDRGFIAQEFEQVFPDLIDEWKDPAAEGGSPYKSVRPDLIPVLVKAIQEQQTIINTLIARVAALEAV